MTLTVIFNTNPAEKPDHSIYLPLYVPGFKRIMHPGRPAYDLHSYIPKKPVCTDLINAQARDVWLEKEVFR